MTSSCLSQSGDTLFSPKSSTIASQLSHLVDFPLFHFSPLLLSLHPEVVDGLHRRLEAAFNDLRVSVLGALPPQSRWSGRVRTLILGQSLCYKRGFTGTGVARAALLGLVTWVASSRPWRGRKTADRTLLGKEGPLNITEGCCCAWVEDGRSS